MVIYRLERRNGYGAFCSDNGGKLITHADDSLYEHNPCTLVDEKYSREYRFGCETPEQLVEYFGSDFSWLLQRGCRVVIYKIHKAHVRFSIKGIEVAFPMHKATQISL